MVQKKSFMIGLLAVLASVAIYPVPTFAASRSQFVQEALSWMTFKKDGKLMTADELKPLFLDTIVSKYRNSKFYQVFVIQFQLGVLPKLTLNEGQSCDPSYTRKYKDPRNSSVTWHFQKQFVAESYKNRNSANLKYCDYRQGLICNQFTSKCECPEGSKMQEIAQGSTVKRCLFEENEICSLIDIDHGNDPEHTPLARDLPKIIFSLEKPVSCKTDTQCRFKDDHEDFPRCYKVNDGPWVPKRRPGVTVSWGMPIGKDCVIGLYANPGSCDFTSRWPFTPPPGFVCYNFGPLRSNPQMSKRTGYCAHELGSIGNADSYRLDEERNTLQLHPELTMVGFVHARTTPLRGYDLKNYYDKYKKYSPDNGLADNGQKCSVSLTDESIELWKYFIGLEKEPPPGQDYVPEATKQILEQKLDEVLALAPGVQGKRYCSYVYWRTPDFNDYNDDWRPPTKCVAHGNPADGAGNDGTCQEDPGNLLTKSIAERVQAYLKDVAEIFRSEREEDKLTPEMEQILAQNPDTCTPGGSECFEGYLCYEDLRDEQGIYESTSCKLKNPSQVLRTICWDLSDIDSNSYGKCEGQYLDRRIKQEFEKITSFPNKLGRGDECQVSLEFNIRTSLRLNQPVDGNKHNMLKVLQDEEDGIGNGFCDITRLLQCSILTGKCECFDNTKPRDVTLGNETYQSDYCYKTSGDCLASSFEDFYKALTHSEKEVVEIHYGKPDKDCKYTNLCLFVTNDKLGVCTDQNTGFTGGVEKPKEPGGGGGGGDGNWNKPPGNGWGEAGVGGLFVAKWNVMGFIIISIVLG